MLAHEYRLPATTKLTQARVLEETPFQREGMQRTISLSTDLPPLLWEKPTSKRCRKEPYPPGVAFLTLKIASLDGFPRTLTYFFLEKV